jgi:hypothetical protein
MGRPWVTYLKRRSDWLHGFDVKQPKFSRADAGEFAIVDLLRWENCLRATPDKESWL